MGGVSITDDVGDTPLSLVSLILMAVIAISMIVIVIVVFSRGRRQSGPSFSPPELRAIPLPAQVVSEIDQLLRDNQQIEALKVIRATTGVGLKAAKERIDIWDTEQEGRLSRQRDA